MNASPQPNDTPHASSLPRPGAMAGSPADIPVGNSAAPVNRWLSIRWVLPAMMLLPVVVGMGLTGLLAFRSSRSAVADLIQEISGEVTNRIEQRLEDRIAEIDLLNNLLVAEFSNGALDSRNPDRVRQYFWQLVRFSPGGDALIYANNQGEFVQVKRLQNDEFDFSIRNAATENQRRIYALNAQGAIAGPPQVQSFDPRQRPWYQAAIATQSAVWTEIYQSATPPDLTITLAVPITNERASISEVVGVDVHLQSLSQFLNGLQISKNGRAFIIERVAGDKGELVATSQGLPFQARVDGMFRLEATASTDVQIRETATYLKETFGGFLAVPTDQPLLFYLQGERQWVDVYSFKDKNLDWLVVVTIPEADFAGKIYQSAQRTLLAGGLITAAVTLLSIVLSRWLVNPIERLTRAAAEIKQNRYPLNELAEMTPRPDEFGELAALFEDMALVVSSREQGLSEQVAALRSEIAKQGKVVDENVSSVIKVLQQSKQVRQTYDTRQPSSQE
ncbi:cache domain-containing protein [Leptolyngbya sp. AN02str]|uniref:cache domain-containing protein n=1 Tax=Leptolyngbya sp. AN02str TaxID=3423363 RepID=UPI003D3240EF